MRTNAPNHALQRTAPAVTLAAPPPSPTQPSRQPPPSLSLRSLGDFAFTIMKPTPLFLSMLVAQFVSHSAISQSAESPAGAQRVERVHTPALSMSQAAVIAEREVSARGLTNKFFIASIAFSPAPSAEASYYVVRLLEREAPSIPPTDPDASRKLPYLKIDMSGIVTFLETTTRRVRVR